MHLVNNSRFHSMSQNTSYYTHPLTNQINMTAKATIPYILQMTRSHHCQLFNHLKTKKLRFRCFTTKLKMKLLMMPNIKITMMTMSK